MSSHYATLRYATLHYTALHTILHYTTTRHHASMPPTAHRLPLPTITYSLLLHSPTRHSSLATRHPPLATHPLRTFSSRPDTQLVSLPSFTHIPHSHPSLPDTHDWLGHKPSAVTHCVKIVGSVERRRTDRTDRPSNHPTNGGRDGETERIPNIYVFFCVLWPARPSPTRGPRRHQPTNQPTDQSTNQRTSERRRTTTCVWWATHARLDILFPELRRRDGRGGPRRHVEHVAAPSYHPAILL